MFNTIGPPILLLVKYSFGSNGGLRHGLRSQSCGVEISAFSNVVCITLTFLCLSFLIENYSKVVLRINLNDKYKCSMQCLASDF